MTELAKQFQKDISENDVVIYMKGDVRILRRRRRHFPKARCQIL